jgi:uncharacterized membrane protein YphA (DoxX/SURF4 family)
VLLRRIARPMFASWFVLEGIDVLRHPAPHAELARAGLDPVLNRIPATSRCSGCRAPSTRKVLLLVQVHAAAIVGAGILLAIGKAPRTAALALAVLTLPSAAVNLPTPALARADAATPSERRQRLVQKVALAGGALLAGIDYEGRPGVTWRLSRARAEHAASRAAGHASG